MKSIIALLIALILSAPAYGNEVELMMVKATQTEGLWDFQVTMHHPDDSSEHLLDNIAIFSPDGEELSSALVPKPSIGAEHVTIQLSDITVAEGVEYIIVRGHCSISGWTDESIIIPLM